MRKTRYLPVLATVAGLVLGCGPRDAEEQTAPPPSRLEEPGAQRPPEEAEHTDPAVASATVEEFVAAYMEARLSGDAARAAAFLGPASQPAAVDENAGLAAAGARWELLGVEAIDANSFEVRVAIRTPGADGDDTFQELLFVGPGAGADGVLRSWVVRGAQRVDQEFTP